MFEFKTHDIRDTVSNKVVAAMETGNPAKAREVLATYAGEFPNVVESIRTEVQKDYGIRL